MKRLSLFIGATVLAAMASSSALAHTTVSIGIGIPGVVVAPAPVYYAPPPVYVAPAPVYVERPVIYSAPVYAPVYYAPYGPYWGWRGHRAHWKH
jgi:hypothetical protein